MMYTTWYTNRDARWYTKKDTNRVQGVHKMFTKCLQNKSVKTVVKTVVKRP